MSLNESIVEDAAFEWFGGVVGHGLRLPSIEQALESA